MHVYILVLKDWTASLARFSGSDFPMFFMSFSVAAREIYTNKNQSPPDRTGKHWPWVTNTCKQCGQPQFHSFNLFDSWKMKSRSVFLQDDTEFFPQQTCSPEVFTNPWCITHMSTRWNPGQNDVHGNFAVNINGGKILSSDINLSSLLIQKLIILSLKQHQITKLHMQINILWWTAAV